jgi:hypothetical protein
MPHGHLREELRGRTTRKSEWDMYISEATFPHLLAARDARIADELERRRVLEERMAEQAEPARPARAMRRRRGRAIVGTRACAC